MMKPSLLHVGPSARANPARTSGTATVLSPSLRAWGAALVAGVGAAVAAGRPAASVIAARGTS